MTVGPAIAENYTLAVVPQLSPSVTHENWKPVAERLGQEIGAALELHVYRTFDEFETDLIQGLPDLVYLNPYHQVVANKTQGYVPLVRDGARRLSGVVVVRQDSPLQTIKALNNQLIGFPDPNAFAASLYMRALLQEKEGIHFKSRYLGSHANVYRHVIFGSIAAGAGVNSTLGGERGEVREQLRVLYETPGVAPHPLSAHPRVPTAVRTALIAAMQRMQHDEMGIQLLRRIDMSKPVRADQARDYRPLEKLHLERYIEGSQLRAR